MSDKRKGVLAIQIVIKYFLKNTKESLDGLNRY